MLNSHSNIRQKKKEKRKTQHQLQHLDGLLIRPGRKNAAKMHAKEMKVKKNEMKDKRKGG